MIATEVSMPRRYDVFSVFVPESLRVMKMREAAYETGLKKLRLLEG